MLAELKQEIDEVEELLAADPDDAEAAQVPHRRCGCRAYSAIGISIRTCALESGP